MKISPINLVSVKNQIKIKQNFNVNNNVSSNLSVDKFEKNVSFGARFKPADYWADKEVIDKMATTYSSNENWDICSDLKRLEKAQEMIKPKDAERIEKMFEKSGRSVDDIYAEKSGWLTVWYETLSPDSDGRREIIDHKIKEFDNFDAADIILNGKKMFPVESDDDIRFDKNKNRWNKILTPYSNGYYTTKFLNEFASADDIGDYIRTRNIFELLCWYRPNEDVAIIDKYKYNSSEGPFANFRNYWKKFDDDIEQGKVQNDYFIMQLAKQRDASHEKYRKLEQDLLKYYLHELDGLARETNRRYPIQDNPELMEKFWNRHFDLKTYENMKSGGKYDPDRSRYNEGSEHWSPDLTKEEITRINAIVPPNIQRVALEKTAAGIISHELCKMDTKAELLSTMPLRDWFISTEPEKETYDPQWDPYYWND